MNGAGNSADNVITGNDQSNLLEGGSGNDKLNGGNGNDNLMGGTGADTMAGGAGDDNYWVDNAGDIVTEGSGTGSGKDTVHLNGGTITSYTLGANVENIVVETGLASKLTGNGLDNEMAGSGRNDSISGGDGNDRLLGGGGDDTLVGGKGNDLLDGGAGTDTMTGGLGNDSYVISVAADKVIEAAGEGTDTVYAPVNYTLGDNLEVLVLLPGALWGTGNALANRIDGNDANNRIDGGLGADTMRGGLGNDWYVVDNVGDQVVENAGAGVDYVSAYVSYTLGANVENLQLLGNGALSGNGNSLGNSIVGTDAANVLSGLGGADMLNGKGGDDTLIGGAGGDRLDGGAGADTFVFTALSDSLDATGARDIIADFSHAQLDRIDLSKIDANGADEGDGTFTLMSAFDGSHGALTVSAQGSQWLVRGDVNGDKVADFAILVTSATALVAADFVM